MAARMSHTARISAMAGPTAWCGNRSVHLGAVSTFVPVVVGNVNGRKKIDFFGNPKLPPLEVVT